MTEKKAKITDENRSESAALLALWKVKHTLSQNDFGEAYGHTVIQMTDKPPP